jgi:hypothetical protein
MLVSWVLFWGTAVVLVATRLMHQPARCVLFRARPQRRLSSFVNGISTGVSDQNPISSAFVVSVRLMSAMGLRKSRWSRITAATVLSSAARWSGHAAGPLDWMATRTDRRVQFWYQILGIGMVPVLCVVLARIFMTPTRCLALNSFDHPEAKVGPVAVCDDLQARRRHPRPGHSSAAPLVALEIGFGSASGSRCSGRSSGQPRYRAFVTRPGAGPPSAGWQ